MNASLAPHSTLGSDDAIITNPVDEQQELAVQREESARRHAQMVTTLQNHRDYVFTPLSVEECLRQTTGQTLATWTIGPVAASLEEGASGQALRERYLEPYLTTQSQYKARLEIQARSALVTPIKAYPFSCSQANNGRRRQRLHSMGAPHSSPQQYVRSES